MKGWNLPVFCAGAFPWTLGRRGLCVPETNEKAYWIAFQKVPGVGGRTFARILATFGSAAAAWQAPEKELRKLTWLEERLPFLLTARREFDPFVLWEEVASRGIKVITWQDNDYPFLLKQIRNPPPLLYVQGDFSFSESIPVISIVGSRHATPYGRRVALELAEALTGAGVIVVSGLARGIDAYAHQGALKGKGKTVAVLGSGLDLIYPRENIKLAAEIISTGGAVVSEFPLGTAPEARNFPIRNRIISGLAWGVVVVEAAERSGALITAGFALEEGREVFAVPGPVNSLYSRGTHALIKEGAKLVERAVDILETYQLRSCLPPVEAGIKQEGLTPEEEKVLALLSLTPVQLEELVSQTGYPVAQLSALLTYLEVKGLVTQLPGKLFAREV